MAEDTPQKQGRSVSHNSVLLVGRLGADAETFKTASGTTKISFRLATNDYWKDKDGALQERTDWHTIIAWGKLAEAFGPHLKKGRLILIEGPLQYRDYEKDGVKRTVSEIVAQKIEYLDSPRTDTPHAA